MSAFHRLTASEQCAAHLREGIKTGRWGVKLPGVVNLAEQLDVSPATMQAALRELEAEGMLVAQGRGRNRTIATLVPVRRSLRIGILTHDVLKARIQENAVVQQVYHGLKGIGHEPFYTRKSQTQLGHDLLRIKKMVTQDAADAWIVCAGSLPVIEWFSQQALPCIALYGRTKDLAIARTGPDKALAYQAATRRLIELGHRRIVLITGASRRKPIPGRLECIFLDELAAHGIPTGEYNLPDWEQTPEGFNALLDRLFRATPPTALIIEDPLCFVAALHFFARQRLAVPEDVSLVSTDAHSSLEWCYPDPARIRWDDDLIFRRIMRWVAAVRRGNADRKTINVPAEFIPGASIGPVPTGRR